MPRVSIGVPTHNGVQFIEDCLRSLQRQTFEDFEVFISDNASTDGTSEICSHVAREDPRFIHSRLQVMIPARDNFTRALNMTSASYFMWRADDDLSEEGYLAGLVDALDRSPLASLAVGPVRRLHYSSTAEELYFGLPDVPRGDRIDYIEAVLGRCQPSWFYGLWRREAVSSNWQRIEKLYQHIWASDHVMILPAILDGQIVLAPGACFIQRIFREASYIPSNRQLLTIRRDYAAVVNKMITERDFTKNEKRRLRPIVAKHLERRVARWRRTVRHVILEGAYDAIKILLNRVTPNRNA